MAHMFYFNDFSSTTSYNGLSTYIRTDFFKELQLERSNHEMEKLQTKLLKKLRKVSNTGRKFINQIKKTNKEYWPHQKERIHFKEECMEIT